jgi:hypothetical protein
MLADYKDWLFVEESSRLLHVIFPNYPILSPCHRVPPKEQWLKLRRPFLGASGSQDDRGGRIGPLGVG